MTFRTDVPQTPDPTGLACKEGAATFGKVLGWVTGAATVVALVAGGVVAAAPTGGGSVAAAVLGISGAVGFAAGAPAFAITVLC